MPSSSKNTLPGKMIKEQKNKKTETLIKATLSSNKTVAISFDNYSRKCDTHHIKTYHIYLLQTHCHNYSYVIRFVLKYCIS